MFDKKSFWKSFLSVLGVFVVVVFAVLTGVVAGREYIKNTSASVDETVSSYASDTTTTTFTSAVFNSVLTGYRSSTSALSSFSQLTSIQDDYEYYSWQFIGSMTYDSINSTAYEPGAVIPMFMFRAYNNSVEWLSPNQSVASQVINGMTYYEINGSRTYDFFTSNNLNYAFAFVNLKSANNKWTGRTAFAVSVYHAPVADATSLSDYSTQTLVMTSLEVGKYTDSQNPLNDISSYDSAIASHLNGRYNWIRYTDSNGWQYTFYLNVYYTSTNTPSSRPMWYYDYAKYYFANAGSDLTESSYYQQGYSNGYSVGYNNGYSEGNTQGSESGYNNGYNVGYNTGYNEGMTQGGNYTFFGLISAVIDAPIQYFNSLFDLNILGYNLRSFLMSMMTLAIVVWLIGLVLGNKR